MRVRKMAPKDRKGILRVAKRLSPTWFTSKAVAYHIPVDVALDKGFVALEGDKIIGFLIYHSAYGEPFISWLGVDPRFQRRGAGTRLIAALENEAISAGAAQLRVETVSSRVPYRPYEPTRAFYKKMGFRLEKTLKREPFRLSEPEIKKIMRATGMSRAQLKRAEQEHYIARLIKELEPAEKAAG
jgi:ribosomal protein S18 acetylase RimI-like enzyme